MKVVNGIYVPTVSIAQVVSVGLGECTIKVDGTISSFSTNFAAGKLTAGEEVYAVKYRTYPRFFVKGESKETNEYPLVGVVLRNLGFVNESKWPKVRCLALFDTEQNAKSLIAIARTDEDLENIKEPLKWHDLDAMETTRYHRRTQGLTGSEYELSGRLASKINEPTFNRDNGVLFVPIPTVSVSRLGPGHLSMLEYCVENAVLR